MKSMENHYSKNIIDIKKVTKKVIKKLLKKVIKKNIKKSY